MLEQKNVAVDLMAEGVQAMAEEVSNFTDGYTSLAERLSEFIEEPDRGAGFVFVGNDTWLPSHLINARRHQQRKVSRMPENGIVWTR